MKRVMLPAAIAVAAFIAAGQAVCRQLPAPLTAPSHQFDFKTDKARQLPDDGVTRVEGVLLGEPHTSNRIDAVMLVNGRDTIVANDIDGVDFERYFQWEDEGIIPLEIDFPKSKRSGKLPSVNKNSKFIFKTVHGTVTVKYKK